MNIAWSAIGSVAAISLGTIIVVAILFGLGTLGMSRYEKTRAQGGSASLTVVGTGVAFVACVAIGLFGLYLTVFR